METNERTESSQHSDSHQLGQSLLSRWRLLVLSWLPVSIALAAGSYVLWAIEARRAELTDVSARLSETRQRLQAEEAQRKKLDAEKQHLQKEVWQREQEVRDREAAIAALQQRQTELAKALDLKDPEAVLKRLKQQFAGARADERADMLFRRGKDAYDAGDLDVAERLFLESSREDPSFAPPRNGMGLVEGKRGHLSVAERYYKSAVGVNPRYVYGWYNLANVNLLLKQPARAREYAERALTVDPEYAPAKDLIRHLDSSR